MNVCDIELKEKSGSLHIRKGKGFKERRTSIPLPARRALQTWLELYEDLDVVFSKNSPLFIRPRGKTGERLSIWAVQDMVSEVGKRARMKEPVTPHILRHTCAFKLRQAGIDLETRAKMLGHSIETASKYGAPGASEISVFLSFTLPQTGMAGRWWKIGHLKEGEEVVEPGSTLKYEKSWQYRMVINGFGAICTAIVMVVFAVTKFREGAWVVLILTPALVSVLFSIHHHYKRVAKNLSLENFGAIPPQSTRHCVIMPVSGVH